jgi:hypothetical protein
MRTKGLTAKEAAGLVNDALRFTITYPGESMAGSVESALNRLRGQGYEVLEVQNSWVARNRYKGIKVRLSSGLEHPSEIERVGTLKAYRRPDR